jgi:uncharacterized protein YjbI with pentapeptide repeats
LEGANFSGADLSDANLEGGDLYWAIFFQANLQRCRLNHANLAGGDFKNANLSYADLSDAYLGKDNLGGVSQLEGANLSNCQTERTVFFGATYNNETIFPVGLNPIDHNMRLVKVWI